MTDLLALATTRADAEAAERMVAHHAAMCGRLALLVEGLLAAGSASDAWSARDGLVRWARTDLLPHAGAEETTIYGAAAEVDGLRSVVAALVAEHATIIGLVDALEQSTHPLQAVRLAGGLQTLVEAHVAKENDVLLPALVGSPSHSVADLLGQMHEALDDVTDGPSAEAPGAAAAQSEAHACSCGEHEAPGLPELDVRSVPHAIRHATVFGALDGIGAGGGLDLVAPHDPLPLLAQIEARAPGAFEVSYLERGPEAWRLRFLRR